MKKLLTILGSVGLIASTGSTVIACGNTPEKELKKLNQKELQAKIDVFINEINKLLESVGGDPSEHPEVLEKLERISYQIYDLTARIYLETEYGVDYRVDGEDYKGPVIIDKTDLEKYKNLFESFIFLIRDIVDQIDEKFQDFIDLFNQYLPKLKEKYESLN